MAKEDIVSQAGQAEQITITDWRKRIGAFLKYGNPSQKALVCEGEAGCGKSEITVQTCTEVVGAPPIVVPGLGAQQQEELLAAVKLVEDEDGNAKLLQGVIDTLIPTEKLAQDPRYQVNGRTCIPWIIDEIWTGNMAQMNQVRAALTFRQIGGVQLPNGVFIIGTTNPEDVCYSSRRSVDAAVMDRVETFKVFMTFEEHQTYLASQEEAGKYPEACRMFLRMEENKDIWKLASARFWHIQFGQTWQELDLDPDIDESLKMKLFTASIADHFQGLAKKGKQRGSKDKLPLAADALVARFQSYIKHGDDVKWYPISANRILRAADTKKSAKEQVDLFKYWNEADQQGFIGVTVQDLTNTLISIPELTNAQSAHIATLLELSGATLVTDLCQKVFKSNDGVYEDLERDLSDTKVFERVRHAINEHDKMVTELRSEQKRRRGGKKKAGDFND